MAIEFHCEHCNKLIKAPDDVGGRRGKCPHCQGVCYIPRPAAEAAEYDMEPLSADEERRRAAAEREAHDVQRRLLHERAEAEERKGAAQRSAAVRVDQPTRPAAAREHSGEDLRAQVIAFVNAMSEGRLDRADAVATAVADHRAAVLEIIDGIVSDDLTPADMPELPRPVLLGFLRQLRGKL